MKTILYAGIMGFGLLAASSAYAQCGEGTYFERIIEENRKEEQSRESPTRFRTDLEQLLASANECNLVSISPTGMVDCSYEKLIGGCGSDHLVSGKVHEYNLNRVRKVEAAGNKMRVFVPGQDAVYTFSDEYTARQAAALLDQYRKNLPKPLKVEKPVRVEPTGGCKY